MTGRSRPRDDRGSLTVELAILAAPLLLVLFSLYLGGLFTSRQQQLELAAQDAARAASLARSETTARHAAVRAATAALAGRAVPCEPLRIDADLRRFTPGGSVTVTVTCTLRTPPLPGLPRQRTFTASATTPVDRYRGIALAEPTLHGAGLR